MKAELVHPAIIEHWVEIAEEEREQERQRSQDRRAGERRCPFFRPASIIRESESDHRYSAFTRDISMSGIGLLHDFQLGLEVIDVLLADETRPLRLDVQWCRSCGAGWFVSGGRFAEKGNG